MRAAGVPDDITRLPGYVNAAPLLDEVDQFDAEFFGFSARDAALTDPQHRLFLETRGRRSRTPATTRRTHPGTIGLFGGCELSTYLYQLFTRTRRPAVHRRHAADGHERQGPSLHAGLIPAQPARAERRRADHVLDLAGRRRAGVREPARRPLRHGARRRRDRARAPARRLLLHAGIDPLARRALPALRRQRAGHDRRQRRRPRRAASGSTTRSRDGDNIRAVILGAGLEQRRQRQGRATRRRASAGRPRRSALRTRCSGVSPESIGYVEAHGTGTILGDPIELSALTEVFQAAHRPARASAASARSSRTSAICRARPAWPG